MFEWGKDFNRMQYSEGFFALLNHDVKITFFSEAVD